jgi:prepilin-type N-terminal cleavage/methylation domain-containing protein
VRARRRGAGGFTLIELLVVIGVIVLLVGGAALALSGRGGEGAALANAQNIVSGMVASARAQAALHQTNARVIVHAQRPPGGEARKYLRALQVVREEPFGTNRFVAAGDPVILPEPVCVVPSPNVPSDHLNTGVVWLTNPAPVSTMTALNSFNYFGRAGAGAQRQFFGAANTSGRVFFIQFGPDGLVAQPASNAKIAVATAVLSPAGIPKFNNPRGVRGAVLRRTGAISLVDDATGF